MDSTTEVSKEKLMADLKLVIADVEELLRASAGLAGEKVGELRSRVETHLDNARATLSETQDDIVDQAMQVGKATDDFVRENPWKSVGIAAGVGLLIGTLIGRR
jgi:ElaB/YqjD/DUF883 family membrane-anchored ribosome-binding protein